jgi:hypothetical protein
MSRAGGLALADCERAATGATHAEIGAYLLGLWGVPYPIVEAVAMHHSPAAIESHGYDLLGALSVSHSLIGHEHALGLAGGSCDDARVDETYLANLNAPFDWQEARRRVEQSIAPAEPQ